MIKKSKDWKHHKGKQIPTYRLRYVDIPGSGSHSKHCQARHPGNFFPCQNVEVLDFGLGIGVGHGWAYGINGWCTILTPWMGGGGVASREIKVVC